jgi:hypothetical protein
VADVQQDRAGKLASPQAVMRYQGRVARVHSDGDPLEYPHFPPPRNKQYRDAAGLREIANQLRVARPLTLLHPEDLISRGAQADVVGFILGDQIADDHSVPWIYITDPRGEQAIKDGIRELSLGYTSRQDGKGRQRGIEIDHCALVPQARCGSSCAVGMDCEGETGCPCKIRAISYSRLYMAAPGDNNEDMTVRGSTPLAGSPAVPGLVPPTDQKDPHAMDELQKQLAAALKDAAEQRAARTTVEAELQTTKTALTAAQTDAANAKADVAAEKRLTADAKAAVAAAEQAAKDAKEQAQKDSAASMDAAVKSKVKLLTEANRVLGDKDDKGVEIDRTSLSEQEIQLAVITQVDGAEFVVEFSAEQKKNPAFVQGLYAGALARADKAAGSKTRTLQHLNQIRNDGLDAARRAAGANPANPGPSPQGDGATVDAEARERNAMINRTRRAQ